ncbi:MAG: MopE-related protein [Myxococcales bacterium]|jgi:hypothetical protein
MRSRALCLACACLALASLSVLSCSSETPAAPHSNGDAGSPDASDPLPDAAIVEEPDAGEDAGEVIVPTDEDGDGFLSDVDCDDTDPEVHPEAEERCDGIDNDCNGVVDGPAALDVSTWYADADGDGYGDPNVSQKACQAPGGFVDNSRDCDDTDPEINPDAVELCNAVDDNCDSAVDEDGAQGSSEFFADVDSDGYGDPSVKRLACQRPSGFVADQTDCDDTSSAVHPNAVEYCNGIDDNCDGTTDEDAAENAGAWYRDSDGDGYGDPTDSVRSCLQPAGRVSNADDCNDGDEDFYPGAPDEPDAFGKDENCDGIDGNASVSVFVSASAGSDANGGRTPTEPVRTLARAMALAAGCSPDPCAVLVAEGTYEHTTPLRLTKGVNLYGGYTDGAEAGERAWDRSRPVGSTVVTATSIPTVIADQITVDTVVDRLLIQGADATGVGQAAIAVRVTATPTAGRLTFSQCEIHAGAGGPGAHGADGAPPSCTRLAGGAGGDDLICESVSGGNGESGISGRDGAPGTGGGGGTSQCNHSPACPVTREDGAPGTAGSSGTSGAQASACSALGSLDAASGNWTACVGGAGQNGGRGGGGGGGGEGGGQAYNTACAGCWAHETMCTNGQTNDGGAGGADGAGGCGGNGGAGGGGGGASFGVVLAGSRATFLETAIYGGRGGGGGDGGNGSDGQPGEPGAAGQSGAACNLLTAGNCIWVYAGTGGAGGTGGWGGGGLGGSAGAGGPVIGVATVGGAAAIDGEVPNFSGGTAGAAGRRGRGGTGGTVPAPDGRDGAAGAVRATHAF